MAEGGRLSVVSQTLCLQLPLQAPVDKAVAELREPNALTCK